MLFTICYLSIGLLVALAVLPFRQWRLKGWEHWAAFATFWPYLIVAMLWQGILAYWSRWGDYLARRKYLREIAGRKDS